MSKRIGSINGQPVGDEYTFTAVLVAATPTVDATPGGLVTVYVSGRDGNDHVGIMLHPKEARKLIEELAYGVRVATVAERKSEEGR